MMYSEFVTGTGCKDSENNYKVFKNLEIMYMNSGMTKEEIYEYGRKLVDNSKSEAEVKAEQEIKEKIDALKAQVKFAQDEVKRYREYAEMEKYNDDAYTYWMKEVKWQKESIRRYKAEISQLKFIIG